MTSCRSSCAWCARASRVIYVPGNHDEWLRDYALLHFGGVEVLDEAVHVTADGRRLLVIHGDIFDTIVKHASWLAALGDNAYTLRCGSTATSTCGAGCSATSIGRCRPT